MKDNTTVNYSRQIRNVLVFCGVILFLYVLKIAHEVTLPLVVALFLFCFASPVMDRLVRLKVPNAIAIFIVLAIIVVIFISFAYVIYLMVNMLIGRLDYYAYRVAFMDRTLSAFLSEYLEDIPKDYSFLSSLNFDWLSIAKSWLASISSKVMAILSDAMLIFVTVLFLLLERTTFLPKIMVAFPRDKGSRLMAMLGRVTKQVSKYLFLKTIISAVTGVLFYFAALAVKLDFALVWGVLAFVLNFIPTIGSIIVTALTILMALIQFFPDPVPVIAVAFMTVAIEMVVGNIIDPRLQGVQLNISPFAILVSLSLWGYIWGIVGMFLAVPLMSIIQITCAIIPSLRPVAVLLSSGKSYVREYKDQEKAGKGLLRRRNKESEKSPLDDVILPEKGDEKKDE